MDIKYLKELVEILDKSCVNKLRIKEKNGVEVTLEKAQDNNFIGHEQPHLHHERPREHHLIKDQHAKNVPPSVSHPSELTNKKVSEDEDLDLDKCIKSPMIGTFYQSESPEMESFVKEGDEIEVGDTLCIIEAMKVMNEIKSDRKGVIKKILVANAKPVEYGQPLFIIT